MLTLQIPSKCNDLGQASHPLIALPLPTLPGENLSETVLRAVAGGLARDWGLEEKK